MPKLNKPAVKHRMAELGITDARELAAATGIPWGSLRNAVAGLDTISLTRVYDVARALTRNGETLRAVVAEILATNDGVPDEPPKQPQPQKAPPKRQVPKGPRRAAA